MSTVMVIAPIVIANWPAITTAVAAAVGVSGFTVVQHATQNLSQRAKVREVIDVDESEILSGSTGTGESIVVEKDGVQAIFRRDARGGLQVCVEGDNKSKAELRKIGEELLGRVTQQYAYHRIVTELQNRGMAIIDEQVTNSESVKIRVRNW